MRPDATPPQGHSRASRATLTNFEQEKTTVDVAQIAECAEVVGSDGSHVGAVDRVENRKIKSTKQDAEAGGLHHYVPVDFVRAIEGGKVHLERPTEEVKREWTTS